MTYKIIALVFFVFSFGVILSAWGFELIGGYQPCELCLQQRLPYYAGVPIAGLLLGICYYKASTGIIKFGFLVGFLIFSISAVLAIRHMGVEWGWWLGPENCSVGDLSVLEEGGSLLDAIKNTHIAYCDEAALRFLGLSFAGWNAIASIFLMALTAVGFLRKK